MADNISDEVASESIYKPPEQKSVQEILQADQGDASLQKYKEMLLGSAPHTVIIDEKDPRIVIPHAIAIVSEGRPDVAVDLSNVNEDAVFKIKEGAHYRLRFSFFVQREIVTGLKYVHKVTRKGITVDKDSFMVGSYAPKTELQSYMTPIEEAPSGMLHRGKYKVSSKLTDDDGHKWMQWNWTLEISKDW